MISHIISSTYVWEGTGSVYIIYVLYLPAPHHPFLLAFNFCVPHSFLSTVYMHPYVVFGCVVAAAVGWGGVWGVWAGPGLVWMRFGVFAASRLWGGRLLTAGHQSSSAVCRW